MAPSRPLPGERGSISILFIAGLIIMLMLGAIAVDSSIAFMRQREAYNIAYDAANDAYIMGINRNRLATTGEVTFNSKRIRFEAARRVAASGVSGLTFVSATLSNGHLTVTVEYTSTRIFAPAFGGAGANRSRISATTTGTRSS